VLRTQLFKEEWKRCFTNDEGRPLGVGVEAQTSNYLELQRLRVAVVNVKEKAAQDAVMCGSSRRTQVNH
jgi:hypothetical protein